MREILRNAPPVYEISVQHSQTMQLLLPGTLMPFTPFYGGNANGLVCNVLQDFVSMR